MYPLLIQDVNINVFVDAYATIYTFTMMYIIAYARLIFIPTIVYLEMSESGCYEIESN